MCGGSGHGSGDGADGGDQGDAGNGGRCRLSATIEWVAHPTPNQEADAFSVGGCCRLLSFSS